MSRTKSLSMFLCSACCCFGQGTAPFSAVDLRCEDLVDPIGVDTATPRLSWRMHARHNGAAQTAYQIRGGTTAELLQAGGADLWDSGKIASDRSQHILYAGKALTRNQSCHWAVRIWNEAGEASDWSKPGMWTFADLQANADWSAKWITHGASSPWLRNAMELQAVPAKAHIHVNSLGYFQLFINGKRVGADEFTPHVSQLNTRTLYLTYDVATYLRVGKNVIGIWLGKGWSGETDTRGWKPLPSPAVRAQLELTAADGRNTSFVTDDSWRAHASSMAYRGKWTWNRFGGEVHDAAKDQPNWASTDFDDSAWAQATLAKVAEIATSAEMLQRTRIIETLTPVTVTPVGQTAEKTEVLVAEGADIQIRVQKALYGVPGKPKQQVDISAKVQALADKGQYRFKATNKLAGKDPARGTEKALILVYELNGKAISRQVAENTACVLAQVGTATQSTSWLVEMGKAMTGTFEITFPKAKKGHRVSLEFGDAYTPAKDGDLPKMNSFRQLSEYICRGSGVETFKNRFNYASCRYILIRNAPPGTITPEDIKGFFMTTELPKASTFTCSDETLNGIYTMMEHTLHCLMLGGYQVDCHSRERQGYGGDGHSSLDTTLCLLRSDAFYRKWIRDWVDGQGLDGGLTYTAPASGHGGGPFWCGFLTAATLKHYQHYGDLALVKRNYPAIKKWLELAQSKTVDGLQQKFCGRWYLGDWASPTGTDDKANAEVFIAAYMAYVLEQGAELADALGKKADAALFRQWADERNRATHQTFYDPQSGTYGSGAQVTYVLPLVAGTVPDDLRGKVFADFEETLLVKDKGHLSTGLSGTYLMIQYLQSIGRDDLIYSFASKKTYPSWGYMLENGATATWEHWNGRASRIHNCYNNIGSWLIQGLAGIRPDPATPGFKNAIIKPAFVKELTYVNGSHDSVYGTIACKWQREGDHVTMDVTIPANSTATVCVPARAASEVTVNGQTIEEAAHVSFLHMDRDRAVLQVGSGTYRFTRR